MNHKPPIIYTGEQLRRYRKEKKLTQDQLSELTKITQAQISNFELGKKSITSKTLIRLLEALAQFKGGDNV